MTEQRPPSKRHPQGEVRQLELVGLEGLRIEDDDGCELDVNAVVAYEYDEQGHALSDPDDPDRQLITIYITNLPTARRPQRIRKLYRQRWPIENQGFREVNQQWHIDHIISRVSADAVQAAMAFKVMVYNAEKILRMKYPEHWSHEKARLKQLGCHELIAGPVVLAYTPDGRVGLLRARRIRELVAQGARQRERERIKTLLTREFHGDSRVQAILHQLDDQ
jgi:hypothetical protein